MSSAEQLPDDEEINGLVTEFADRLIDEGLVTFRDDAAAVSAETMRTVNYRAILEGFGFSPGFIPNGHNTLWDTLNNEALGYLDVIERVKLDGSLAWLHVLNRAGFEEATKYWYQFGAEDKEWGYGFPWPDGVSAKEFMDMSEQERSELLKNELAD